jgi:hypothetical protein
MHDNGERFLNVEIPSIIFNFVYKLLTFLIPREFRGIGIWSFFRIVALDISTYNYFSQFGCNVLFESDSI